MKKVIVLLVLISVSMVVQAQVCKLKNGKESRDLAHCKKGDILSFWGFTDKTNLITRTACDFTQTVDHKLTSTDRLSQLHCVYIGYQRTERK